MALNRVHNSTKGQQSSLITVKYMAGKTYRVLRGVTRPSPN